MGYDFASGIGGGIGGAQIGSTIAGQIGKGFGPWGMLLGGGAGALLGLFGGKKKKPGDDHLDLLSKLDLPEWYEDQYYKPTQDLLFGFGKDLLAGNPNEYYKPLGEVGGSMFEDVVNKASRDIRTSVAEMGARTGTRGGAMASATANAIADKTTDLRWADFLRAMEGRSNFLNVGNNMISGVRGAGLQYQGQRNQFNLNRSGMFNDAMMQQELFNKKMDMADQEGDSDVWSNLVQGGMTLAGSLLGGKKGGGGGGLDLGLASGGGSDFYPKWDAWKSGISYGFNL